MSQFRCFRFTRKIFKCLNTALMYTQLIIFDCIPPALNTTGYINFRSMWKWRNWNTPSHIKREYILELINKGSSDCLRFRLEFVRNFPKIVGFPLVHSFSFQLFFDYTSVIGVRIGNFPLNYDNNIVWIHILHMTRIRKVLISCCYSEKLTASISSSSSSIVDTVTELNLPIFLVCLVTMIFLGFSTATWL